MARPLALIIVEDSEDDVLLVVNELRRAGFAPSVSRVETGDDLTRVLTGDRWDLVISDHSMPHFSSTAALTIVRRHDPDLPFIIVSGSIGEEFAVEAMRAGASDFVVKDRLARLAPAIERELADADGRRQRRRAEEALKATEEQLRQAQKLEAVGRLAGGVAHDFNNLLTAILGYSEFLLDSLLSDDERRVDVEEIKKAGERAASLTRQLLAFSRQQVLELRVLNLNEVVRDVERLLRRVIGEDIEIQIVMDPELGRIKADPVQISQILMNLAVNARDAMPHGGRLTIEAANVDVEGPRLLPDGVLQPGPYVLLCVTDTGTGIAPDVLPHIFEPFFTTKDPGKGTGLGLSTVYGIVRQSGGWVQARNGPGGGAIFTIYLPRTAEVGEPAGAPVPELHAAGGGRTILLVEDDAVVRELAAKILTGHGYRVLTAAGAEEALRPGEFEDPVDLLLTDVVLPGLSGLALAERLTRLHPGLKVLYMSGFSGHAALGRVQLARAKWLQKPFAPATLAKKVAEVLGE